MGVPTYITKGLQFVGPTLDAVSASADVFPPLKSAASGALWIVNAVKEFKSNQEDWTKFSDYVAQSIACVVANAARSGNPRSMEGHLKKLQQTLEKIQKDIGELQVTAAKSKLKRFGSFLTDRGKINDFKTQLDQALSFFNLGSTIESHNELAALLGNTSELLEKMGDLSNQIQQTEQRLGQRMEVFDKRSNLDRLKRADGSSWNPKRVCLPGTRDHIIDEILLFAAGEGPPSPHRIQLVHGVAGCGKTAIASSVSQRCAEAAPPTLGSSFLFSFEAETRKTPDLLFSTIAHDLSKLHPALSSAVSDSIEKYPNVVSPPLAHQFRHLLLRPVASLPPNQRITIVIDALDEGFNDELLQILAEDCAQLPSNCRIIITSRPESTVMMYLDRRSHILLREIDLGSERNLKDVAVFARQSLLEVATMRGLGEDWPGKELTDLFIRKAEGLFIWVATVSYFIRRATDPTKLLGRLLEEHPYYDLNSEAKMSTLYSTILAACPWEEDEDFARNYQPLMGAILALKIPVSSIAIKSILDIDLSVTEALRPLAPVLRGILGVKDGDKPLRILHDSFREFATRRDISKLPESEQRYMIDAEAHNRRLALYTLRLLSTELGLLAFTLEPVAISIARAQLGDIPTPAPGSVSEALWYCARYFVAHLTSVSQPESILLDALREFARTNLLRWMTLCAMKGDFQGISSLLAWSESTSFPIYDLIDMRKTASLLFHLARQFHYMRRLEEALAACRESVEMTRRIGTDRFGLANSLDSLSIRLSHLGYREDALDASREAVELYRQLAEENPTKYSPHLARALSTLPIHLSNLGRRPEALEANRESVALCRTLAKERPKPFTHDLALALDNMSESLASIGYISQALEAIRECVELHRQFAQEEHVKLTRGLAHSVYSLSIRLSQNERHAEALESSREAVTMYRELIQERPGTLQEDLAKALNNLSICHSTLGQHEMALAASRESLEIYRQLAKERPLAYGPELAMALSNYSESLADVGQFEEALKTIREAVNMRRPLARDRPSTFIPDLAHSLNALSARLAALDMKEDALEAAQESTDLYRRLAKEQPTISMLSLARALSILSIRHFQLGHHDEAIEAGRESLALYRALAEDQPGRFRNDVAMSYNNLAIFLSADGKHEDALDAIRGAAKLRRELAKERPAVHNPALIDVLDKIAYCLDVLKRDGEAGQIRAEADLLRKGNNS